MTHTDPYQKPLMAMALVGVYGFVPSNTGKFVTDFTQGDSCHLSYDLISHEWRMYLNGVGGRGPLERIVSQFEPLGFQRKPKAMITDPYELVVLTKILEGRSPLVGPTDGRNLTDKGLAYCGTRATDWRLTPLIPCDASQGEAMINLKPLEDPWRMPLMAMALHGIYGFRPDKSEGPILQFRRTFQMPQVMQFDRNGCHWLLRYSRHMLPPIAFEGKLDEILQKAEPEGFQRRKIPKSLEPRDWIFLRKAQECGTDDSVGRESDYDTIHELTGMGLIYTVWNQLRLTPAGMKVIRDRSV